MNENEMAIFKMISASGDSRGAAFAALRCARRGDFSGADEKLQEAKQTSITAHDVQTKLITAEINGEASEVNLLMVHAQDHLMTSLLARDLIEEMVEMLKEQSKINK